MSKSSTSLGTMAVLASFVLCILKLTNTVDCTWWVVIAPVALYPVFILTSIIAAAAFAVFTTTLVAWLERREKK